MITDIDSLGVQDEWGVGYPSADVIKTRIQSTQPQLGICETAVELVNEANGRIFSGLYRGFGLKLVRSIPVSMIGFSLLQQDCDKNEQT